MTTPYGSWVMVATWPFGDVTYDVAGPPAVTDGLVTFPTESRWRALRPDGNLTRGADGSYAFTSNGVKTLVRPLEESDARWLTRSRVPELPLDRVVALASDDEGAGRDALMLALAPRQAPTLVYVDPRGTLLRRDRKWVPLPAADPLGLLLERDVRHVPPEAIDLYDQGATQQQLCALPVPEWATDLPQSTGTYPLAESQGESVVND